jgi:hypothetical protein
LYSAIDEAITAGPKHPSELSKHTMAATILVGRLVGKVDTRLLLGIAVLGKFGN